MVSPLSFTQTTQLRPLTFIFTSGRANTTAYLSPAKSPPHVALPHIRKKMKEPKSIAGRPHCAKGFAYDLPVISANKADHQSTLDTIQHRSASLNLILKPLSYCFSGKSVVPNLCFRLGGQPHCQRFHQTSEIPDGRALAVHCTRRRKQLPRS